MENLMKIVQEYNDRVVTEDSLRKQIQPVISVPAVVRESTENFLAFKKACLKGMYLFVLKDIPKADQLDADQLRGLLFNRLRTEVSNGQFGFSLDRHRSMCHRLIIQFTRDKSDVERITLYSGSYSNKEVIHNTPEYQRAHTEEKFLSTILSEMRFAGTMKDYLANHGLKITESSRPENIRHLEPMLDYATKNFNSNLKQAQ